MSSNTGNMEQFVSERRAVQACILCNQQHKRCKPSASSDACEQCEKRGLKCTFSVPKKRGPKAKGNSSPGEFTFFLSTKCVKVPTHDRAKAVATRNNYSVLSSFDTYHLTNGIYMSQLIDIFVNTFRLHKVFSTYNSMKDHVKYDISDEFLKYVVVAMAAQRMGNKSVSNEFFRKANEKRKYYTKKRDRISVGLALMAFFTCMENDSNGALTISASAVQEAEKISNGYKSSTFRLCLFMNIMISLAKIIKQTQYMRISTKIVDPYFKDVLRAEMQEVIASKYSVESQLQDMNKHLLQAERMIANRVHGIEEPVLVSLMQRILLDVVLNPYDNEYLLQLLQKVDQIEIYLSTTFNGNEFTKAGLEYCMRATRIKILAMFNTTEALVFAAEEANRCTNIATQSWFKYSACYPTMFLPIVAAMHIFLNDQERAMLDCETLKQLATRYAFAVPVAEAL